MIARQVGVSRPTVSSVRSAFAQGGVDALRHDPERQRSRRKLRPALEKQLIETTLHTPRPMPPTGAPAPWLGNWECPTCPFTGLGNATICNPIGWKNSNSPTTLSLRPRCARGGTEMNPPDRALVLCVDEKSQIQALDRTAPILPLRPKHLEPKRMTIGAGCFPASFIRVLK